MMRRATKITASCLGIAAGIVGLEHSYFFNDFFDRTDGLWPAFDPDHLGSAG